MNNKHIQTLICLIMITSNISWSSEKPKERVFFLYDQYEGRCISSFMGITPLHCAQTLEEAQDIVKYEPYIDARDHDLLTATQHMIFHGRKDIAQYLISIGATFNRKDCDRITAIMRNKKQISKTTHAYITERFFGAAMDQMMLDQTSKSLIFFKSSEIADEVIKELSQDITTDLDWSQLTISKKNDRKSKDLPIPK